MKTVFDKRAFNDRGYYASGSMHIGDAFLKAIRPIFEKYMEEGYSPRELSHLTMHAALDIESEKVLELMHHKTWEAASEQKKKTN
jgi:hypothetical protein